MRRTVLQLFILLMLAASLLPSSAAAKRVALVIGIDQYDNLTPAQQLKKAVNDFHVCRRHPSGAWLRRPTGGQRRAAGFLTTVAAVLNRIEPGDDAALFFAGHGVEISGLNFLLPRTFRRRIWRRRDLKGVRSFAEQLLGAGTRANPQMMLYVIDACRDNPFVNTTGRSIGGTRGLTLVEPPSGTFVMFSAGAVRPRSIDYQTAIPIQTPFIRACWCRG